MSYLVTAPCVVAKDQDGRLHHVYEGGVISWLSDEQAAHFLESELVQETDKGVGGSDPDESTAGGDKPAADANKPELVQWVYDNMAKEDGSDYTKAELNKKSPEDLRELIDSVE